MEYLENKFVRLDSMFEQLWRKFRTELMCALKLVKGEEQKELERKNVLLKHKLSAKVKEVEKEIRVNIDE